MPICPKCGKSLCSEQALSYHLNKKFKCGTWKCITCSTSFDTKLSLQLHELKCGVNERTYPDYSVLRTFYDKSSNVCCELRGDVVVSCNDESYVGQRTRDISTFIFKNERMLIL